jgi:hypothetical protein
MIYGSYLTYGVITLSIAFTTQGLLRNGALWYDTAAVALNLISKDYPQLFGQLDHHVVAPSLFLVSEKFIHSVLGFSDFGLVILPFFCFLIAIPLLWAFSAHLGNQRSVAWATVCIYCASPLIRNYAIEAKPYASDVCIAIILLLITLKSRHPQPWQLGILVLVASISILFSYSAIILVPALGLYLLYVNRKDLRTMMQIVGFGLLYVGIFFWSSNLSCTHHLTIRISSRIGTKDTFPS